MPATGNQLVIDVMVLYTANAMFDSNSLAGAERSNSQMETDIAASYQGANDALAASGVNFSVRVVHMREVLTDRQAVGAATLCLAHAANSLEHQKKRGEASVVPDPLANSLSTTDRCCTHFEHLLLPSRRSTKSGLHEHT